MTRTRHVVRRSVRPLLTRCGRRVAWIVLAVAVVTVAGIAVRYAGSSRPGVFDTHVDAFLVAHLGGTTLTNYLADLGGPVPVAVAAAVLVAFSLWMRSLRAAALAVAVPLVTYLLGDLLIKPLVGRTLDGDLAYPSGHTAGVFSIAAVVIVLAAKPPERRSRRAPALAGTVLVVLVVLVAVASALALVAEHDHYATDTIGGAALALGVAAAAALSIDLAMARRP